MHASSHNRSVEALRVGHDDFVKFFGDEWRGLLGAGIDIRAQCHPVQSRAGEWLSGDANGPLAAGCQEAGMRRGIVNGRLDVNKCASGEAHVDGPCAAEPWDARTWCPKRP